MGRGIFHCYVSLPEGSWNNRMILTIYYLPATSKGWWRDDGSQYKLPRFHFPLDAHQLMTWCHWESKGTTRMPPSSKRNKALFPWSWWWHFRRYVEILSSSCLVFLCQWKYVLKVASWIKICQLCRKMVDTSFIGRVDLNFFMVL